MKQVEFEQQLCELKRQKKEAQQPLADMIAELKEQMQVKRRIVHEMSEQIVRLSAERSALAKRVTAIIREYDKKINDFRRENLIVTRNLENVSDWSIARELHKRGYRGTLDNDQKSTDSIATFNANLNSKPKEENEDE